MGTNRAYENWVIYKMAIRINPLPAAQVPAEFKTVVRAYLLNGVDIAKLAVDMPTASAEWIAEQLVNYNNAKAAWARLHTWKKTRWSLCAIKTWGNLANLKGQSGYSGYSLYIQCWLDQVPPANGQPISPCSARVTDPNASPWNYQP